jgi:hypothetical protein
VSGSWFCKWKDGDRTARRARRDRLEAEIARLFAKRKGKDGSPRITAALGEVGWTSHESAMRKSPRFEGNPDDTVSTDGLLPVTALRRAF